MKYLLPLLLVPSIIPLLSVASIPKLDLKPVTFTVETPSDDPVDGALVEASLPGPGNAVGKTGKTGKVVLSVSSGATLHLHVSKIGYYSSGGELWTGGIHTGPEGHLVARELPSSFTILLKPIIDPAQLTTTRFRGRAPASGKPLGFDLAKGDWVAPHGQGSVPDLLFHFHDILSGPDGFAGTLTLAFPNKGDGIQPFEAARPYSTEFGSNLAPPHQAPVTGYQTTISRTISHREGEAYPKQKKDRQNYLFRTRTIIDQGGVIRQACYGWIEGEIEFDPRGSIGPQLKFTAHFNADPNPEARSLEPDNPGTVSR